jgi:gamma-glutamylcyclotransferase (GGCT)/AIG2-like uncharacterized protein YtfP
MPNNESRSLTRSAKAAVVHKVIDITPEAGETSAKGIAFKVLAAMEQYRGGLFAAAAAVIAIEIALLAFPHHHKLAAATVPAVPVATAAPLAPRVVVQDRPITVELNLQTAVQHGAVQCQWRGNGKDLLFMDAHNLTSQPLRLHLPAGQILASEDSTVVLLRSATLDFTPQGELHNQFPTLATSSANRVIGAEYHLSEGTLPDMDKLLAYAQAHPDVHQAAIQTTALILSENLPLSAFAKFNELNGGVQSTEDNKAFKADTVDILTALSIVQDLGINRPLAVTIDPQLEVEAMIDPAAHDLALRYYNITDEWAYWKNQLLQGDPSTRHYALYGIARYYPAVALQMLPKWARGTAVGPVYRMSAVEALAETNRAEAIPILRDLEREFGGSTDLGRAAHQAANFLDAQFAHPMVAGHGVLASAGN